MTKSRNAQAAPLGIGAALLLGQWLMAPAGASPDGAEWATADDPEGCASCHLGGADAPASEGLIIEGLPEQPEAGRDYDFTIELVDSALRNAGFLLRVTAEGAPAGELVSVDERTESMGALARSTWNGAFPPEPGRASWRLVWTAPAAMEGPIRFDLWANAGNDDASPLGDRPRHSIFEVPAAPAPSTGKAAPP